MNQLNNTDHQTSEPSSESDTEFVSREELLEDGIDWDEVLTEIQNDPQAGEIWFNSADYPTWAEASLALLELMQEMGKEAEREQADPTAHIAVSP